MVMSATTVVVNEAQLKLFKAQFITEDQKNEFREILEDAVAHPEPNMDYKVGDVEYKIIDFLEQRLDNLAGNRSLFYCLNIDRLVSLLDLKPRGHREPYKPGSTLDGVIDSFLHRAHRALPTEAFNAFNQLNLPEGTRSAQKLTEIKEEFARIIKDAPVFSQSQQSLSGIELIIEGQPDDASLNLLREINNHSNKSKVCGAVGSASFVAGVTAATVGLLVQFGVVKLGNKPPVSFGPVLLPSIILGAVALVSLVVALVTSISSHLEQVKIDEAVEQRQVSILV